LKHHFCQPHEFPYRQSEIKDCYEEWLFESCRLNTGRYIFINQEGEDSPYGEITALKHSDDGWHGKFGGEREQREYRMSKGWVNKIFGDYFQTNCIGNHDTWLRVPPGNPKQYKSTMQSDVPVLHPCSLRIKYPQGQLRTCMIGSLASCLYYMGTAEKKTGMAEKADAIMKDHGLLSKTEKVFNSFFHIVNQNCKDLYKFLWNKEFSFDQEEQLFDMPTMVVLVGRDNSMDHAITVYKDMIFDTSTENVLSRCRQTLDWCCPTGFQKIDRAYSLKEKPEHEKKQTKKPKRKRQRQRQRPST